MSELINTVVNVSLGRYINVPSRERFALVLTFHTFPAEGYTGNACAIRAIYWASLAGQYTIQRRAEYIATQVDTMQRSEPSVLFDL